jgi:hypothetical protein
MTPTDLAFAVPILGFAAWLLHRSFWKRRGACPGCTTGCSRPPAGQQGLVSLGRSRPGAR